MIQSFAFFLQFIFEFESIYENVLKSLEKTLEQTHKMDCMLFIGFMLTEYTVLLYIPTIFILSFLESRFKLRP